MYPFCTSFYNMKGDSVQVQILVGDETKMTALIVICDNNLLFILVGIWQDCRVFLAVWPLFSVPKDLRLNLIYAHIRSTTV